MNEIKQYHPVLVVLHWVLAFLIIFMLLIGTFSLKGMPNDAAKIQPLQFHMIGGITIGVLMLTRLVVRWATRKPPYADTGSRFLNIAGKITHVLLYLFTFGMLISGMGLSQATDLSSAVQGIGALPEDFFEFPVRYGHGFLGNTLLGLVALHIGAALYHQFIRKDNLFARMSLKRK